MDIWTALSARYAPPEYALFFEVASGTGYRSKRYADAVAMSLFPSRGLYLYGFEVKMDRGDWLKEKKNPEKAEAIAKYMDFWWLVTTQDVAMIEEIPATWGWLLLQGTRLVQQKAAQRMTPQAIDRPFLAALLRRRDESALALPEVRAKIEAMKLEERKKAEANAEYSVRYAEREAEKYKRLAEEFRKITGIELSEWNVKEYAVAAKAIVNCTPLHTTVRQLLGPWEQYAQAADNVAYRAKQDVEMLKKLLATFPQSPTGVVESEV